MVGCDLDGSKLYIPDHLRIPQLPEMVEKELIHRLTLASQPGLATADLAFLPSKQAPSPPEILDKEVRSIFLLFLVRTLQKRVSRLKISKYSRVFFVNIKKVKKLLFGPVKSVLSFSNSVQSDPSKYSNKTSTRCFHSIKRRGKIQRFTSSIPVVSNLYTRQGPAVPKN